MLCYQSENENALSAVPSFHGAFSDINFPIMNKARKSTIEVKGSMVTVISKQTDQAEDLLCLTDIAKFKNAEHPDDVIRNWLRNRNTVEFLGAHCAK
jgi:hypothetical protein